MRAASAALHAMQIIILKNTSIKGIAVKVDQIVDAEEHDAITLINMGKAIPAPTVKRKPRSKVQTNGDLPTDT